MKIFLPFFVFSLFISILVSGQEANRFFPKEKLITTGTFYYPEHWSESQWDRDFKNIAAMGFEYVHMAEFAWAFLEPEQGKYDFSWLDKAITLASKHGLKVLLCTPTATTPVWMGIKYPEVYIMNSNYMRGEHGSRQNNSLANPKFRELSDKITETMAKHYGNNPNVWGWQLDNEPEAKEDYSPSAQEAFRSWLEKKYQTIEKLNAAWGTAFWSLRYSNFDEIKIHNTSAIVWWGNNPHALLDFKRFTAEVEASFLNEQADILRKYILPTQFITTNYVAVANNADPRLSDHLDFPAFTSYPNGGSPNLGEIGFRLGDPTKLLLANDYFRPIKGLTGVMEIQPGQVNWGNPNPLLMPGTVRMWLWQCFGAGARFASSYRYRQILYGVEQYHAAMIENDGVTPSQGGKEYIQFNKEIKELQKHYNSNVVMPPEYAGKSAAILWNHENLWDQNRQPQNGNWNIWAHTLKYHQLLKSLGAPVDYISEKNDFTKYPILIVPAYQAVDSNLVQKWKDYAEQGGDLIITCRTATKTREGHFWEAGWGAPIYDLIGAKITAYDMLPEDKNATVSMDGKNYTWNKWGELIEPYNPEYSKAIFSDQFYAGKTAVTSRKLGKGTVTYVGVETVNGLLEKEILRGIIAAKGIKTTNYPEGVFVNWRDGFWVAINYSSDDYQLEIPEKANIIIGDKTLKPAGVAVWKE
jgi:beta-galactosidase